MSRKKDDDERCADDTPSLVPAVTVGHFTSVNVSGGHEQNAQRERKSQITIADNIIIRISQKKRETESWSWRERERKRNKR